MITLDYNMSNKRNYSETTSSSDNSATLTINDKEFVFSINFSFINFVKNTRICITDETVDHLFIVVSSIYARAVKNSPTPNMVDEDIHNQDWGYLPCSVFVVGRFANILLDRTYYDPRDEE